MPGKEAYRRSMKRAFAKETRLKAKAMKREQKRGKLSNGGEAGERYGQRQDRASWGILSVPLDMTTIEDRVKGFIDVWEKRKTGELPPIDMRVTCQSYVVSR
jgi:hypothetical protein